LLTDIQYPSYPGQNVSYSYDGYGRPAGVTDGQGTETYAYDDRDMLTSKVVTYTGLPAMTIGRAYYPDGSEQTVSTPAGDFSFLYDGAGRLISQTNPYAETTQYSYLNNNWLAAQLYANGLQATFTYNALGHLIDLTNSKGATIISQYSGMTYDGFGQRLSVTATVPGMPALSGVTSYGYDSKNQLISEVSTRAGGYSNSFVFDSAGNPTIFKGGSRTYNVKNQLTGGSGLGGFTYDGEGNPTTYNGASLTFDVNNRPTSFGSLLTAGYTSFGYRAWKQDSGGTRTYYLYDNGIPIVRLSAAGAVAAVDTFGPTGLVSSRVGGISGFYAFDERGTTAERLDAAGAIMSHRASDAFGTLGGSPASGDPYDGFDGQLGYYTDSETGLTFCTNRYYDPATGRWLTRDPIKYSGGINQYSYVVNNPVFFADPTGLAAIVQLYRCYNIIIGAPVVGGPSIPFVPIEACYLQHVFIRFDKPCSIRGKLSGGSAGLYPYWHSGIPPGTGSHGGSIVYPDPGARPDPSGPGRPMHVSLVTNNDSNFETALCKCVNQSNGVWAFINNCSTWSTDMWRCAKKGAYGQGSWPFTL
jgi:RHS repeat-associated protein